jgi:hypothetical protein
MKTVLLLLVKINFWGSCRRVVQVFTPLPPPPYPSNHAQAGKKWPTSRRPCITAKHSRRLTEYQDNIARVVYTEYILGTSPGLSIQNIRNIIGVIFREY